MKNTIFLAFFFALMTLTITLAVMIHPTYGFVGGTSLEIDHLNPEGLPKNPAFSQAISIAGPHRTIYVGEQNAVNESGEVVGKSDIKTQTEQVFRNLKIALGAAKASLKDVMTWKVYIVNGQSARDAFEVFQKEWGQKPNPPTISLQFVSGLAHPDFLIGIDAVAVVEQ